MVGTVPHQRLATRGAEPCSVRWVSIPDGGREEGVGTVPHQRLATRGAEPCRVRWVSIPDGGRR